MLDLAALARRVWEEVWPADDEALLAAVLHRQFRNHAAPSGWSDGLDGAAAVVHQLNGAFSDLRYVTLQVLVDGDRVAVHNTCTGRHTGVWAGLPPTGRKFSAEQVHILRFDADGLAVEHWAVRDDLTLLRQLDDRSRTTAPSDRTA